MNSFEQATHEQDLINQEAVIKDYCSRYGLTYQDTVSRHFGYDYILEDRQGKQAIAEVKCRTISKDQYPNYMTSAHKVHCLGSYSKLMGVQALLIVRFIDELAVWFVPQEPLAQRGIKFFMFKRTGEPAEPCVQIPLKHFTFIGLTS